MSYCVFRFAERDVVVLSVVTVDSTKSLFPSIRMI